MAANTDRRSQVLAIDAALAVTGAFRCLENMAELLAANASIILVLPKGSRISPRDSKAFAEILYLPIVSLRKSPLSVLAYLPALLWCGWRLAALARRKDVSCLIVNDFFLMQGAVARLFGYRGRLVSWVRIDPLRFPAPLRRLWLAAALRASNSVVAVSDFIGRRLPPSMKAVRIYDSVALLRPAVASAPHSLKNGLDVVFVGNYTRGKGQDHAVSAFARIADEFPEARLRFYGGDFGSEKNREFRSELVRSVERLGLDKRITFQGFIDPVEEAYETAVIALNLSVSESFSLTCLEASTFGLPVVAFRSGGPEEIIADGETGFLCPIGDIDAVADALRRLLRDPELRSNMGRAGAERAQQTFGPRQFVESVRAVLFRD